MATAQATKREINAVRKELAQTGADPFQIAAEALQRNAELLEHIYRLEQMLRR